MGRIKKLTSHQIARTIIAVSLIGLLISIRVTENTNWLQLHLSRLGEGGHWTAAIFNFTLIIVAVLVIVMAQRLSSEIHAARPEQSTTILRFGLIAMAICAIGVASFPYDKFHYIHNSFGYSMFGTGCLLILALKKINPIFSNFTYTYGYIAVGIGGSLLMSSIVFGNVPFIVAELVGLAMVIVWMAMMTDTIEKK